jgi:hypothetical protein
MNFEGCCSHHVKFFGRILDGEGIFYQPSRLATPISKLSRPVVFLMAPTGRTPAGYLDSHEATRLRQFGTKGETTSSSIVFRPPRSRMNLLSWPGASGSDHPGVVAYLSLSTLVQLKGRVLILRAGISNLPQEGSSPQLRPSWGV